MLKHTLISSSGLQLFEADFEAGCKFFSDESWFCLTDYVNSQNNRYWSTVNPHYHMEPPFMLKN